MRILQRVGRAGYAFVAQMRDFASDARGNVAMLFGLTMPIFLIVVAGGIDINRVSTAKVGLQDALDAAALAAARSPYTQAADIQRVGMDALKANLAAFPATSLVENQTTFILVDDEIVVADAKINVKTLVANIVLPPYGQILDDELPVGVHSEVNRSTKDIEVSLVLDITGSMASPNSRIRDLKSAANSLVDLVVQDQQNINRTRMALVPYSMGVNPGAYIDTVRGTPRGPTSITGASWKSSGWSAKPISGITIANNGIFTSNGHGLAPDDFVWVSGVTQSGNGSNLTTLLNDKPYKVVWQSANTFSLQSWNGSAWSNVNTTGRKTYAGGGSFQKCQISTCEVVIRSDNHGLETGYDVKIRGVNGMTQINNAVDDGRVSTTAQTNLFTTVTKRSDDTFSLNGRVGPDVSNYTSGGTIQCLEQGCREFLFQNLSNNHWRVRPIVDNNRSCVSERIGSEAYTDASAATAPVGAAYASTDNPCLGSVIQPLTSDRDVLHSQINGYTAVGSTAGQIGVGWGWYMVSPTFGSIFPASSRPDPYDKDLLKVVVIMTDGEFNTPYCNGVVAGAVSGSGSTTQHINCAATNGNPFAQAVAMCTAMKRRNVIVYTVGFDIGSGTGGAGVDTAKEVMQQCATDASHVYLPSDGSSLKTAFAAIGRSISQLRISR